MDNKTAGCSGIELLQIALIILKLLHKIDWPWIWVLAPTWIGLIVAFIFVWIYIYTYDGPRYVTRKRKRR